MIHYYKNKIDTYIIDMNRLYEDANVVDLDLYTIVKEF